jgi:hypothetical protein
MTEDNLSMPNAACWKKLLDLEAEAINAQVRPRPKISIVSGNATANTNIISNGTTAFPLNATKAPCIFRIYVCLATSGIFSVQRYNGAAAVVENLNQGVALTANAAYMFDILVDQGEKIDFQTTVTSVITKLSVVEKDDAK